MSTYRIVWYAAAGVTVLIGLAGTVLAVPPGAALAIGLTLSLVGGVIGYSFESDLPDVKHPVLAGAAILAAPGLYPGLSEMLGIAALGVVTVLIGTCPYVANLAVRRLRGRVLPSEAQLAAMAPPDEALRLQWEESTRQLEQATSMEERLLVVRLREQVLDDVMERFDGALPDYVWRATTGRGGTDLSAHGA